MPLRLRQFLAGLAAALAWTHGVPAQEVPRLAAFRIVEDAIAEPLGGMTGDVARGQTVAQSREAACTLCHAFPGAAEGTMGNIAPPLDGVGGRRSAGQLRLRLVDSLRLNPQSPMPAYYRVDGLSRVASAYRDKPIMSAQEIEDVIAYLLTLR